MHTEKEENYSLKTLHKKCFRSFFGPYFLALGLNTEICSVNVHIQYKYGKIRTGKTPNMVIFHAVSYSEIFITSMSKNLFKAAKMTGDCVFSTLSFLYCLRKPKSISKREHTNKISNYAKRVFFFCYQHIVVLDLTSVCSAQIYFFLYFSWYFIQIAMFFL